MAIIKCPECGHQISEKATICPSCGVEIAGKIVKCLGCGEVFFKDDGLCPHCYKPYKVTPQMGSDSEDQVLEEMTPSVDKTIAIEENGDDNASNGYINTPSDDDIIPADNTVSSSVSDDGLSEEDNNSPEIVESQEKEEDEEDKILQDDEGEDDNEGTEELAYIDTDEENLERPVHEVVDDERPPSKHGYMPVVVSIAITALIAAVCFYFYNDSKMSRETQAFEVALKSGDIDQMNKFLRDYDDATQAHKKSIKDRIQQLEKEAVEEQDYAYCIATRDKAKVKQYLNDNPETSHKTDIINLLDSIDWEDALKTNTRAAFEKYIAEHQTGAFVKDAKEKLAVQLVASTEEDNAMAKSLFREFFLSVNANDALRLTPTLSSQITNFMGTESASSNDVVSWMKRQHKEDVSSVIWKLNHDYKIVKRVQNEKVSYSIEFTAKQTIVHKDGRASSENYKISSDVTESKRIASMNMTKYTPQSSSASATTGTSATSNGSTSAPKPSAKPSTPEKKQESPKASGQKDNSQKTGTNGAQASKKPSNTSSSSSSKPSSGTTKKENQ